MKVLVRGDGGALGWDSLLCRIFMCEISVYNSHMVGRCTSFWYIEGAVFWYLVCDLCHIVKKSLDGMCHSIRYSRRASARQGSEARR